ncbi:MAG: ABC transporter substrate-binding protein [Deltaproteobacteria bacterium]|nr:ABC transporter substrate-binding protein [Deltaproteobacteria bacterium]MBW2393277.1 ABC transporter substrate-binding protein [Deltaproteobacteria bacterium]
MWRALILAFTCLASTSALSEESIDLATTRAPIEAFYEVLMECMKNAESLGLEGRKKTLEPAIEQTYDLPLMSAKVLGRHWRGLTDEDKNRWLATFRRITIATYAERFDGWDGEKLLVLDAELGARGTRVVHTRIEPSDGDPVDVHYRMKEREGRWRVMDVFLNGTVSELALRRSEYGGVIKTDGLDALIERLEAKIEAGEASNEFTSDAS